MMDDGLGDATIDWEFGALERLRDMYIPQYGQRVSKRNDIHDCEQVKLLFSLFLALPRPFEEHFTNNGSASLQQAASTFRARKSMTTIKMLADN